MNDGIGINGTGRIGRLLIRKMFSEGVLFKRLKVINTLYPVETIAHLLTYDSVHGRWDASIVVTDHSLIINDHRVEVIGVREPEHIRWKDFEVDIVVDATGKFNDRNGAMKHLAGGASTVLLTAPGKQVDRTFIMGVNHEEYDPGKHVLLSAASCTTNCLVPLLHILDQSLEVKRVGFTTIHSYTNDQKHLDNPHHDLRRARSCIDSIIPTTTGAGESLKDILPHLAPVTSGYSIRVPTSDVSLLDVTIVVSRPTSSAEVRDCLISAARGAYSRYIDFTDKPLVSVDYIGCSKSAVVDGLSIMVQENQIKLLAWYDNEWGYVSRVNDLLKFVQTKKQEMVV